VNGRAANSSGKPLLTIREVAELVGVDPSTLYRTISRGDFPVPIVGFGDRIKVPRVAVEKLIYGDDAGAPPDPPERSPSHCSPCSATKRRPASCSPSRRRWAPPARP
jgi:excisionase family DNA binding protein